MSRPAVIGIAGYKNAGKTTLVERLVAEFTRRGLAVSTVKHAHHAVDVDRQGRDSHRHRQAGAREVALVTARRWAIMHELGSEPEPALSEIIERMSPADLVIVEGFKTSDIPKIEVRRVSSERGPLAGAAANVIAVASDGPVPDADQTVLDLDDISTICDFIATHFALETSHAGTLA